MHNVVLIVILCLKMERSGKKMDKRTKEIVLGQAINIVMKNMGLPNWENKDHILARQQNIERMYQAILNLHKKLIKE